MTKITRNAHDLERIPKSSLYELLITFLLLAIFFSLSFAPQAFAQDNVKVAKSISDKIKAKGKARIIVKLNTTFQPEGLLSGSQAVKSQQSQISKIQDKLREAVSKYGIINIKKFKYTPYAAMEVDSDALEALISSSLVASIEEDIPAAPILTVSVPLIRADQAWAAGYTGSGWSVAILDTGVDKTHSFIGTSKVVAEACYSTNSYYPSETVCPNGYESQTGSGAGVNCSSGIDGCDHGTHVAGIAAGNSSSSSIYGVAKDASIIAIQVFSKFTGSICTDSGYSTPCVFSFTSDQNLALEHVYSLKDSYNIAAVNLSLGGDKYSSYCDSDVGSTKAVIDNLRSAGIATVIASGNSGYTDGISAPACISTAVSVGATTKTDAEASYSNYHPTMLSLFAPGSSITSSIPGNGWATWSGTSMATPHVTGTWAILKQKTPTASVSDLLNNLQSTGASITLKVGDLSGGAVKRIDVLSALNAAGVLEAPTGLTASLYASTQIKLTWTDNSTDEKGFTILRKTGKTGTYGEMTTAGSGVTTYTDSSVGEGVTYCYRVRAYNDSGSSAYSNESCATTPLTAPAGLVAYVASKSQIYLYWADNSGNESSFIIERAVASGGPYTVIAAPSANVMAYSDTGLASGTTYYYRVKAVNADASSSYSNEAYATTAADGGGGGGGGGGCFIATAAFGTPMEKHVRILRVFRDRILLEYEPGRAFVRFYYNVSPPVADYIASHESLRFITRGLLMPLVGVAYLMTVYGVAPAGFLIVFCLLAMGTFIRLIRRRQEGNV